MGDSLLSLWRPNCPKYDPELKTEVNPAQVIRKEGENGKKKSDLEEKKSSPEHRSYLMNKDKAKEPACELSVSK